MKLRISSYIQKNDLGIVLHDKSFKELTTMRVGGRIKNLYYPNSIESLQNVLKKLNYKNFFIIGNGSNVIASDHKYKKLVISLKQMQKDIVYEKDFFVLSAFMDLRKAIYLLAKDKISTLAKLIGIPGTVGGAIVMNAGAYYSEISEHLLWVKYLENEKIIVKKKEELQFFYRNSEFKNKNRVIIEAAFSIIYDENTKQIIKEISEKRKERHPLEYPNSGSIFRNGDDYLAYQIIKKINLYKYKIGNAMFSEKHANFIVNLGNAKANDVFNLIVLAKKRALIFEKINLKEEVILLNFPLKKFLRIF